MIRFLRNITNGKRRFIVMISFFEIIEVGLSLAFIWYSKILIDVAMSGDIPQLKYYAVIIVILLILQIVMRIVSLYIRNMTDVRLGNYIRNKIFSQLMYSEWDNLRKIHSGDMITRIIRDTDDIVKLLTTVIPLSFSSIVQFIGALYLLFSFDPILALILGLAMPLITLFSKAYYIRMRRYSHAIKESESDITAVVEESIINHLVVRTFEKQEFKIGTLTSIQEKLKNMVRKKTYVSVFANSLMNIAFGGGYVTAFLWSANGLLNKTISFGTVTAYLQIVARIQRPIFDLMRLLPTVIAAKTSIERLGNIFDFKQEIRDDKIYLDVIHSLHIDNVLFGYDEKKSVLKDFSMIVETGQMVALVGETGIGKTTVLKLLLGLMKPQEGCVYIQSGDDKVYISELTRSNFIYVPQGNSLFSGSIRDNLLLGDYSADDDRLYAVLTAASALFVYEFCDGLDTIIGEKGSGLSEGQAQRIAIARALLRPGKIILMDEATSALDVDTEKIILNNIREYAKDRIVIFITHHKEVAYFCDNTIEF